MPALTAACLFLLLPCSGAALALPPRAFFSPTGLPRWASNRSMLDSVAMAARLRDDAGVLARRKLSITTIRRLAPSSQKLGSRLLSPVSALVLPAAPSSTGILQQCTQRMLAVVSSKLHWIWQIFCIGGHAGDGAKDKKLQEAQAATALGLCKNLVLTLGKGIIGFTANSQVWLGSERCRERVTDP